MKRFHLALVALTIIGSIVTATGIRAEAQEAPYQGYMSEGYPYQGYMSGYDYGMALGPNYNYAYARPYYRYAGAYNYRYARPYPYRYAAYRYSHPYRYRYAGLYNYRYAHPYRYQYAAYRYAHPYRYQYADYIPLRAPVPLSVRWT